MHAFAEPDGMEGIDGIGRFDRIGQVGAVPLRLTIGQGYTVLCLQGAVWLTCESEDRSEAARDIVLACGERFDAGRAVTVIVSAIRRRPARIALTRRNTVDRLDFKKRLN
ncbi:DUF2917 domain-containing protein [Cupriavidus gilardii]|uniref:DUF2917 domain-containing protein n=1 Tax=Cupriavidus gilardii TaxID=82541 RepID=UPI0015728098|nr:DUF2917 domain-containing protein [Cupriavidus gilardii]NSX03077.1 DUF2917 domain-containing protein [Cupriavidus gilardii]